MSDRQLLKSPSDDSGDVQLIAGRYSIVDKLSKGNQARIYTVFDVKSDGMLAFFRVLLGPSPEKIEFYTKH